MHVICVSEHVTSRAACVGSVSYVCGGSIVYVVRLGSVLSVVSVVSVVRPVSVV